MKTYKECCKYDVHNDVERTVTILRPDGKKYIVDYPDNIGENHWVPDWIHPIEEKLTKLYFTKCIRLEMEFK